MKKEVVPVSMQWPSYCGTYTVGNETFDFAISLKREVAAIIFGDFIPAQNAVRNLVCEEILALLEKKYPDAQLCEPIRWETLALKEDSLVA